MLPLARRRTERGFTIVELIVVVSIIAVLMGLLLPALGAAKRTARSTKSQSNMRQIGLGLFSYAGSNKEILISPSTSRADAKDAWVNAEFPANIVDEIPGEIGRETLDALYEGAAYPYLGDSIYASPLDLSGRVRSYSLNGFLGINPDPFYGQLLLSLGFPQSTVDGSFRSSPARSLATVPIPDKTMHVIPEDHTGAMYGYSKGGWNLQGWLIDLINPIWIDVPAYWGRDGINIAFLDGRVEFVRFSDPELEQNVQENVTSYESADWEYFRRIMMPGLEKRIGIDFSDP